MWYHYLWNGVTPARNLIASNRALTTCDIIIWRFDDRSSTTHRTNHYTTGPLKSFCIYELTHRRFDFPYDANWGHQCNRSNHSSYLLTFSVYLYNRCQHNIATRSRETQTVLLVEIIFKCVWSVILQVISNQENQDSGGFVEIDMFSAR